MVRPLESTFLIAHPLASVWQKLVHASEYPLWMPHITAINPQDAGSPLATGSQYEVNTTLKGADMATTLTVRELEPQRYLALLLPLGGINLVYTYELAPDGEGSTHFTMGLRGEAEAVSWKALWPMLFPLIRQEALKQGLGLQKLLG